MNNLYNVKKSIYQNIKNIIAKTSALRRGKKIKIVNILAAYNEEDIINYVLNDFITKNIQVYFIDHHSTDKTSDIVKKYLGKGVTKIETFPEESGYPSELKDVYAWRYMLKRKEELHSMLGADWYMHMDADAILESPWEDVPLVKAIQLVDMLGYNCIDFELFNFRPVNGEYDGKTKPQDFFRYWEPDNYDEPQIKCWKNFGQNIDLVSSGGHIVEFEGKKVFPVKFIMKHYPIRGREHGIKKIFAERLPRYDKNERDMHWHTQYDRHLVEKDIKFSKRDLLEYDDNLVKQIYLPLLNCLNILEKKDKIVKEKDRLITSIYFSRSWKIGRFLTTPWRWMKKILLRKE